MRLGGGKDRSRRRALARRGGPRASEEEALTNEPMRAVARGKSTALGNAEGNRRLHSVTESAIDAGELSRVEPFLQPFS